MQPVDAKQNHVRSRMVRRRVCQRLGKLVGLLARSAGTRYRQLPLLRNRPV